MNDKLNIEDLFRDSFDRHSVEPGTEVWSGISKKLWMRQLGDFFKISFEGYQINPSTNLWSSIARRLWFYNFLRFNPASFNVYYLGLAVSVITGIMISSNLNQNNSTIKPYDQSIILNNDNSILTKEQQTTAFNNTNKTSIRSDISVADNSTEIKNTVLVVQVNKNNLNKNQNIIPVKNNVNNQVAVNIKRNKPTTTPIFFKDQGLNAKDDSNNQKLIAFNPKAENSKNTEQKLSSDITDKKMLLSMLQPRSSLLTLAYGSEIFIPDTLGYNFFGAPIVIERVHWSVDAWWSPIYNSTMFVTKSSEFQEYTGMLRNATSEDITYTNFGGDLNYSYKNWIFQLGVFYAELGQKMRVPITVSDIRQSSHYNYFENNILHHDTIWFYDMDALLHGDTVLIAKPVETWIVQKDSNLVIKSDTLKTTTHHTVLNRYSYLEIPIMAGYEIHKDKFSFSVKGGVAAGFFIRSAGSVPASNGYESVSLSSSELPYVKPNFTLLFSLGISYHLNDKFAVFGEPYLRKNVNSIFENKYIYSQKFQSVGVKFGLKYTFK